MSNDNMDKFFSQNREGFDDKTPSGKVWTRIERSLFGTKSFGLWNSVIVWRAAAAVFLGLSVFLFLNQRVSLKSVEDIASQQEFLDVESYYAAQISEKVSLIQSDESFMDDQFAQDFEKLEAMYSVLAEELKKHPSQKVKDALVLNMLVRIDLLNQQIQKLEELRTRKSERTEV